MSGVLVAACEVATTPGTTDQDTTAQPDVMVDTGGRSPLDGEVGQSDTVTGPLDGATSTGADGEAPGPAADVTVPDSETPEPDGVQPGPDTAPPEPVLCPGAGQEASTMLVAPYLQLATPTSMWIRWETETGAESRVEWGPTEGLGYATCGSNWDSWLFSRLHAVHLEALAPDTRYFYRTVTGDVVSETTSFVTPEDPALEGPSRIVVASDMQQDGGNPLIWQQVIEEGIIPYTTAISGGDVADAVDLMMIPGDLVDQGWNIDDWRSVFFPMSSALSSQVPIYPVLGNHEGSTPFYYDYFQLPDNGTAAYAEHWWWHDQGNVRIVGLDSNVGFRMQVQLDWLDVVLQDTCTDPTIDFVFAQLHHPFKSELWLPGEIDYTGDVISRLETFSTTCDKPSIHFFGHTHGYSRGQSRDHAHLWVNAASAGGNIDYWGEYAQADYPEFTVTTDDWGFVFLEVTAGDSPSFRLRRISRGDESVPLDNVETDDLTVRRDNLAPATPNAIPPAPSAACSGALNLSASPFDDLDGDAHDATHWQLAATCDDFEAPLFDTWVQRQNVYANVDLQAGDDLEDHVFVTEVQTGAVCMRVRYRDTGLAWSEWSEAVTFHVGGEVLGDALVTNPGAEDGEAGWTVTSGELESLAAGDCDGIAPASGDHYFSVGGLCVSSAYGEARQTIPLSAAWSDVVDSGSVVVVFGASFATWAGDDEPAMTIRFLDAQDELLGQGPLLSIQPTIWTPLSTSAMTPIGTRSVELVLSGTRNSGADNDSYLDDVHLTVMACTGPDPG